MKFRLLPLLNFPLTRDQGTKELIISQTLVVLFLISFLRGLFSSPGAVPDTLAWQVGAHTGGGESVVTREIKVTGERRHCKWCTKYKPDRCHHCRICKTCVLKMDHHCPWIMNCVGHRNYKFFFLVVNYAVVCSGYIGWHMWKSVSISETADIPHIHRFYIVLGLVLCIILGSMMTMFGSFHYWLMYHGITTIEYCEKISVESSGLKQRRGSLYDRGLFKNIQSALGPNPLLWIFPISTPDGDGLTFEVAAPEDDSFKVNNYFVNMS